MQDIGIKANAANLEGLGVKNYEKAYWNIPPAKLVEHIIKRGEGTLSDTGAIAVDTGEFTGRSPADRFVVCDDKTEDTVWWGDINFKFKAEDFDSLHKKLSAYLEDKDLYVRDCYAGVGEKNRIRLRVATELPLSSLFANNMFLRPDAEEIKTMVDYDWGVLCAPGFMADAAIDNTRQHNFAILNFTKKMIIIGGTGYTGEIKKGIFSVLNYILPHDNHVLSMHCSANVGDKGDVAIFFGLSGTGKTTLSADPERGLIGDDEHGWGENGIFNFEGGCYAKCIDLTEENEPQIYRAIKFGAILENTRPFPGTSTPNYEDISVTQNTRTSYPIDHIDNAVIPSEAGIPKNIFFLTHDAYGVLPPISKLNTGQAMYHFISGYTAKVAGTEVGIDEPQATFSACFGAAFLPLHPTKYAELLGEKMEKHNVNVWLVNTGYTGGAYGEGSRMKLKYTRAMITAALNGELDGVEYIEHPVFGVQVPQSCPNIPVEVLNPRDTWNDKEAYDRMANKLAAQFVENFEVYADEAKEEILNAAPRVMTT